MTEPRGRLQDIIKLTVKEKKNPEGKKGMLPLPFPHKIPRYCIS